MLKNVEKGQTTWSCHKCIQLSGPHNFTKTLGGTAIETSGQNPRRTTKSSLRILQWNANGISPKAHELEVRLHKDEYDICLIQETKLKAGKTTPKIKGYTSIRLDRPRQDGGGGLLSYIKDTITFERVQEAHIDGTEISSFRVRIGRKRWAMVHNLYCPPDRSHTANTRLNLNKIVTSPEVIVLGDFNAHSQLWDRHQPPDKRGEIVLDWITTNDLTILNDGATTRTVVRSTPDTPSNLPRSGGASTPDLSICGSTWADKYSWSTVEGIGNSDHLPIAISINTDVSLGNIFKGNATWRTNGVDWDAFTNELDIAVRSMDSLPPDASVHLLTTTFQQIIVDTAKRMVGRVKPGKRARPWMTPKVREAIRIRNKLRKTIGTQRTEWIEACKNAQDTIREAKADAWKKVLEECSTSPDDAKMWKTIRQLKGSPESNSPNEAMDHNGRLITCNRKKADIFALHYAGVSKLKMSKKNRKENRLLKQHLRRWRSSHHQDEIHNFTATELQSAILRMRSKGAPGPDDIPPTFLKHLGPRAFNWLLHICNKSLHSGEIPQMWRNAVIIPILKAGKSPAHLSSFRPISLTSCVMKLLERMVCERLNDLAEANQWFSHLQAGFRKSRGVEDQIVRLTQQISDGFERREKSIMVLLDFSKAYDTIWRQRLLLTLTRKNVPSIYVQWLSKFLENRQAKVRFNGMLSRSRKMDQGLPQGSVLAPILFLFYINELATILPTNITASLYADDVTILSSSQQKSTAEHLAQQAVNIVKSWSDDWKLQLNGTKSEVAAFSKASTDSNWRPAILINNTQLQHSTHPRLLGIILDRTLSFNKQIEEVTKKVTSKMRMLWAVSNSTWGWNKYDLRKLYLAHIRSTMCFASSGWQPWLSDTNLRKLEGLQNKCLRLISGQTRTSPNEAWRVETGIPSISSHIKANCLRSREKALRLPPDHPRRLAISGSAPTRLKNAYSLRIRAEQLSKNTDLDLYPRKPLAYFEARPWERGLQPETVFPNLEGISGKHDGASSIQKAALCRARTINADYNIYTDGSASAGTTDGGAGVVITTGDPGSPVLLQKITERGAALTSSYDEEVRAMQRALDWVEQHLDPCKSVAIFTDSQSLCVALAQNSPSLDTLRSRINSIGRITIQWIPGHCEIVGNEWADETAKLASSSLDSPSKPISYGSACAHIRERTRDPPPVHQRVKAVYEALSTTRERQITNRRDQTLLAQLRSGHSTALQAYRHRIGIADSPLCPRCQQEPQDLEHWFQRCPATEARRRTLFGAENGRLDCLTRYPRRVVALARSSLLGEES